MTWLDKAVCASADADLFFSDHISDIRKAQSICFTCPVIRQCQVHAQQTDPTHGVWGGLTQSDLRKLRNRRVQQLPAHGTRNRYSQHGCRCDDCRAANAEYLRKWRAA